MARRSILSQLFRQSAGYVSCKVEISYVAVFLNFYYSTNLNYIEVLSLQFEEEYWWSVLFINNVWSLFKTGFKMPHVKIECLGQSVERIEKQRAGEK